MDEQHKKISLKTEKHMCSNCGASLIFNPQTQTLSCPYCFSSFEVEKENQVFEKSLAELLTSAKTWEGQEIIECTNCGAKEIVSEKQIATNCSFCGTTNIVKTSEMAGIKPHGICPFEKTLEEAKTITRNWVKKQKFTPNKFKKDSTIQSLKGTYAPAFSFDCHTSTDYDGRLGETESDDDSTYTRYFNISGNYKRDFDDILVHSSATIPFNTMMNLEPFPTQTCAPYSDKYLAGYTATTYTKDGNGTWQDCQTRVSSIVRREILNKYDYDKISYFNAKTTYNNTKFKYMLLPVYVGHHTYKNKNYNFYVNGSTGKISGKAPKSGWKIFFLVFGIAVGITAAVLLGRFLGNY